MFSHLSIRSDSFRSEFTCPFKIRTRCHSVTASVGDIQPIPTRLVNLLMFSPSPLDIQCVAVAAGFMYLEAGLIAEDREWLGNIQSNALGTLETRWSATPEKIRRLEVTEAGALDTNETAFCRCSLTILRVVVVHFRCLCVTPSVFARKRQPFLPFTRPFIQTSPKREVTNVTT